MYLKMYQIAPFYHRKVIKFKLAITLLHLHLVVVIFRKYANEKLVTYDKKKSL